MKLNLGIIIDSVSVPYDFVVGNTDEVPTLTGAYPYLPGCSSENDIVFHAKWNEICSSTEFPCFMIVFGGGIQARDVLAAQNVTALVFSENTDRQAVIRRVHETFVHYAKLERELFSALLSNASTRAILNVCAQFFECHLMMFDINFALIEYSDAFLPGDDDLIWRETLAARKSVLQMLPRENVEMLPNIPGKYPRSTFLDLGEVFPRHINIAFDCDDSRIATLIFYESGRRMSQRMQWIADSVAEIISPIIVDRYHSFLGSRNYLRQNIVTALRHSTTESAFLHANLARYGWRVDDNYQVLLIDLPPESNNVSHYMYNYENIFADFFDSCLALHYDSFILILLHNEACNILDTCLPTLKKQLELDDGTCCIGTVFSDFSQLKLQYRLASLPLRLPASDSRVRYYRDVMGLHLVNELSARFPLRATCHYAAVKLSEYDTKNGTNFLLTLETYLMHNKSILAAAAKLFIHRSTMTYRLKCIDKIVPLALDDPDERLHILLSCAVLRTLANEEKQHLPPLLL